VTGARTPAWSVTMLTLPDREPHLMRLLAGLRAAGADEATEVVVVYNAPARERRAAIIRRLKLAAPGLHLRVHFNQGRCTIAEGRNVQLALCRAPLVCFVDDDLTLHGPVFATLAGALRAHPVALVGLPSLQAADDSPFKPRADTPFIEHAGLRHMPVQGMLCATYGDLLRDVGGFSPLREFWGEWTELNTRLWRLGFPTGYRMHGPNLRHWHDAPHSPTRHRADRARHIVWGLACTALEYDAVDAGPETDAFWTLIERRYLAYAYDPEVTPSDLFRTVLELAPRLVAHWPAIRANRARAMGDPFSFRPFQRLSIDDVLRVRRHAAAALAGYKARAFAAPPVERNAILPDVAARSGPFSTAVAS
jgi:hypothetical protein